MNRRVWVPAAGWTVLIASSLLLCVGVGRWMTDEAWPPETGMAAGLLGFNGLCFAFASAMPRLGDPWNGPAAGLGWLSGKLFVNTFTIFLFIGLQAGRTPVFVGQFFGGYFWLLAGSVWLLTRNP